MTYNATTNIELIKEKTQNIDIPHKISTEEQKFVNILCTELGKKYMRFDKIRFSIISFHPTYDGNTKNIILERKGNNQTIVYVYNESKNKIIVNIPFIFFFIHIKHYNNRDYLWNFNVLKSVVQTNFKIKNIVNNEINAIYSEPNSNNTYSFRLYKKMFKNEWYIKDCYDYKYIFNQIENTYTNNLIENYKNKTNNNNDSIVKAFFN